MDSMRHLSTSLPHSSRRRNEAELLSSFKSAALSVTNLFKAAAADSAQARDAGYQDALEDLLAHMDQEKIGLGDGEGWNIRRWLLQRIEDAPAVKAPSSDDGEESQREDGEPRSASVEIQKKSPEPEDTTSAPTQHAAREQSVPPVSDNSQAVTSSLPSAKDFTFRSTTQYPTNHDREGYNAMDIDASTPSTIRPAKTSAKLRHGQKRDGRSQQSSVINLNLGPAAGSKRKNPYSDFFDISGITFDTDRRDNSSRGGKRARQT